MVAVQRRTVAVLVAGQILGGLGIGATLSLGSVLAADVSGNDAFAGAAATLSTLGAGLAALPLARLTERFGRHTSLAVGTMISVLGTILSVLATALVVFPLLLLGFTFLGAGAAVGLQSRFAATDVASTRHRSRDLSIVVWSATIGSVAGPNLVGPGEVVAAWVGMPTLTGSFLIGVAAQLVAAIVYFAALRPDPYFLGRAGTDQLEITQPEVASRNRGRVLLAISVLAISHAVMVSVMSMTPVHLMHHGAPLAEIGATLSVHIAGMYGLSPIFGWLSDRVGYPAVILGGQILLGLALAVISQGSVGIGLVLLGLGWSASTVAASAMLSSLLSGTARARVQGRSDLVMNLAGALGGAIAGPVLATAGYEGLSAVAAIPVVMVVVAVTIDALRATQPSPLRLR
ncbi:MFS transporter [Cryobacterium lactosi]|nr:MFS transporter [Cryobacterium lactosi]